MSVDAFCRKSIRAVATGFRSSYTEGTFRALSLLFMRCLAQMATEALITSLRDGSGLFSPRRRQTPFSWQPPRVSTMAPTSQRKRGREDGRSTLDSDIQDLNHAMATCGISRAQGAFDSAGALLTTIRVRPLLTSSDELRPYPYAGLDGRRRGLRGSWANLRRCV